MAEVKHVRAPKQPAPMVDRWLLNVESEEAPEPEIDPYGGRFFGDQFEDDSDDSEFDRVGGGGLFGF